MAFQARLVRGNPHIAKHTASGNLAAGDVVIRNDQVCVVHPCAIADGAEGSVAIFGGEWELAHDNTSGPVVALGEEVFWDDTNNQGTDVSTGNVHFGQCTVAAGASDSYVTAFLNPRGDLGTNEST